MPAAIQSITLTQVREAISRIKIWRECPQYRSAVAARVIDGVRVVDCPMSDERNVYDWTQCDDGLRDGDVFLFANGTRAGILVEAWPTVVVGDAEHLHTLAGATWESLDGGKYAAAAAVAVKLVAR
ncbi:hypothetical protein R77560_04723 [Ralstonia thomasii]|jgi:hypothetical protein|uniref:Uncharacterized protein n=1 Tax=Ralstonia thomasii TaxID=3058596 RepID=A0AAD2C2G5_9RALS|nr:hypothetical protein [Ralstonia sp. LMG 18095]CAJ0808459.1 hypothetical protein R77560_04723 [Ralstonia sp. LMG 18095]